VDGEGRGETREFNTKTDAVNQAAAGRTLDNARVVIRKQDGKIQSERTDGSDPRRTRG
jgi:hypothetical protein